MNTDHKRAYMKRWERLHRKARSRYMKKWRHEHQQERRDYQRQWYNAWYPENKIRLAEERRRVWAGRRKPLEAEKIELCRQNPGLAKTIAGPSRVVCLKCGRLYQELGSHLAFVHDLNGSSYRDLFGWNAPMVSVAREHALREVGKRVMADRALRLKIAERRGAKLDWFEVIKKAVRGVPNSAIAKELGVGQMTISRYARKLGLGGPNCLWCRGLPVGSDTLGWLKRQAALSVQEGGISVRELSRAAGLPEATFCALLRPHRRLKPNGAQAIIELQDRILRASTNVDFRKRRELQPCSQSSLLISLVPNVRSSYGLLCRALKSSRRFLRKNPGVGVSAMLEFLRREASPQNDFLCFLRWAPSLEPALERDLNRLRGGDSLQSIACEWIGSQWNIRWTVVQQAVRSRTPMVPDVKVASLIREICAPVQPPSAPEKSQQRPAHRPAIRRDLFHLAAQTHAQGLLSWRKIAIKLIPDECAKDPKAAAERLRKGAQKLKSAKT